MLSFRASAAILAVVGLLALIIPEHTTAKPRTPSLKSQRPVRKFLFDLTDGSSCPRIRPLARYPSRPNPPVSYVLKPKKCYKSGI
jgi:hypothetical protein